MEEQRNANVALTADISQYQQGMAAATTDTDKLVASIDNISKKLSAVTKTTGKGLTGLGVGIAGGLTAATLSAGKFEKNLSTLAANAAITNKNFNALAGTVKGLAKDFPVSLNQTSQLVTMLSQMGVVSEQQINKMSQALVKLSGATGADLVAISGGLVELGRTMGTLNTNNIETYANSLVNVSSGAGVAAQSVLEFSNAIAPVARIAGMTEEQVLGISGAFSKAGADGYAGATAFNRMVYGLTRSLQFGGPELKTYSNLLGTTTDTLQKMEPAEAIVSIFEELNKQGPLAIKTLDSLGLDGLRTIRSISAVISSGSLRDSVSSAVSGEDSLTKGSEEAFSGLNDQFIRFGSSIQQFGISIGENLTFPLSKSVAAANQLMSVMNAIANSPIGTAATFAAGGVGAVAGTVGLGLLGAGMIGKVATGAMGLGVARAGWGGMRLGQGVETGFGTTRAAGIITDPAMARGWSRFRPSTLMARGGYALGQAMGPLGEQPGLISRIAATPLKAATWMTEGQQKMLGSSEIMKGSPVAQANAVMSASLKDIGKSLSAFSKQTMFASAAQRTATTHTVGLSAAFANLTKSSALLGMTYGRTALAGTMAGVKGLGSMALAGLGGGPGLAIMGGIGAITAANWYSGLDEERSDDWGTLGINRYMVAAGLPGTATMSSSVAPEDKTLPPVGGKKGAALVTGAEISLAEDTTYEYIDPTMEGMQSAEQARGYVLSMGYIQPEVMQQIGQDLTARFDASTASEILSASQKTYPRAGAKLLKNWPSLMMDFEQPRGEPGLVARAIGGIADVDVASMDLPFQAVGSADMAINPISGDFWRNRFGMMSASQKAPYEAAVEGIFEEKTRVAALYGTEASDLTALVRNYQTLTAEGVEGNRSARNEIERLLSDEYGPNFDLNYPGFDALTGKGPEETLTALAGASPDGDRTFEELFNEQGMTLTGAEGYEQVDLSTDKGARRALVEIQKASPTFSTFQQTDVGGWLSKPKRMMQAASDDQNKQLRLAQGVVDWATDQSGAEGAYGSILEAYASASGPQSTVLETAMQLEQRRFDQGLAISNMNQWDTQNIQIERYRSNLESLLTMPQDAQDEMENYQEFVINAQNQVFNAEIARRESYESVILANREFNVSMARADEEYNISRTRATEDYNLQIEYAYEDFYLQQERMREDFHRNQNRSEADFARNMARMVEDAMSTVYDPYTRITTEPTLDASNLMMNIEEQNQALRDQEKNLKKLKRMGVSQDAIDFLGLADPNNAQQLGRLLGDLMSDPKLIKELNKATQGRESATEKLVASHWSRAYRRAVDDFERLSRQARHDFKIAMDRTIHDFDKQMERADDAFNKNMRRMAEDHKRMLDNALEDFNRAFKEVQGSFEKIEQRALKILADAGVKTMDIGERQMDRVMRSIEQKFNKTMKWMDRLIDKADNYAPSAASTNTSSESAGSGGVPTTNIYAKSNVDVSNSGSTTTAPQITPSTPKAARRIENRGKDDNLNRRNKFLRAAYNQIGKPYVFGSDGPDSFDCSGLTSYVARKAGVSLWGDVSSQYGQIKKTSRPIPGDLVFYDNSQPYGSRPMNHMGIYVGSGKMLHAPNSNSNVQVGSVGQGFNWTGYGKIPGLKDGGIHRGPAVVGEGGNPEVVIPLNSRGHDYMFSMYKAITKELVKEMITKQLGSPMEAFGGGGRNQYINASTEISGSITVKADDPNVMLQKLEASKRRAAILKPSTAKSS